jgi:LysM repeat protein
LETYNRIEPTLGDGVVDGLLKQSNDLLVGDLVLENSSPALSVDTSVVATADPEPQPDPSDLAYQAKVDHMARDALERIEAINEQAQENLKLSALTMSSASGQPFASLGDPLDLSRASEFLIGQMMLQRVLERGLEKEGMVAVANRLGKKLAPNLLPLVMSNPSLTHDVMNDLKAIYPDIWAEVFSDKKHGDGRSIFESAGYSSEIIDRMDPDVLRYFSVVRQHEQAFPIQGPGVEERLKADDTKCLFLMALANKNVQRSLKWAGLIAGCASGGIVVKAGITGGKFLVSKLGENEAVQSFMGTMKSRSIDFVSKAFNIDREGVAERVSKNRWVALGATAAVVGLAVAVGSLDMVQDALNNHVATLSGPTNPIEHALQISATNDVGLSADTQALSASDAIVTPDVSEAAVSSTPAAISEGVSTAELSSSDKIDSLADRTATESVAIGNDDFTNKVDSPVPSEVSAGSPSHAAATPNSGVVNTEITAPISAPTTHEVVKGDSLWKIAERHLESGGQSATNAEIQTMVNHIYEANKDVIGSDPDKIFPGQVINIDLPVKGIELTESATLANEIAAMVLLNGVDSDSLTYVHGLEGSDVIQALQYNEPAHQTGAFTLNLENVKTDDLVGSANISEILSASKVPELITVSDEEDVFTRG